MLPILQWTTDNARCQAVLSGSVLAASSANGALSSYEAAVASYREANIEAAATQEVLRTTYNHIGYVLVRQGNLTGQR